MALELRDLLFQVAVGLTLSEGTQQEIWSYSDPGQANIAAIYPFHLDNTGGQSVTEVDLSQAVSDGDYEYFVIIVDDSGESDDADMHWRIQYGSDPDLTFPLTISPGKFAIITGIGIPLNDGTSLFISPNATITPTVVDGRVIVIGTKV